jgi:hypothetical protein
MRDDALRGAGQHHHVAESVQVVGQRQPGIASNRITGTPGIA